MKMFRFCFSVLMWGLAFTTSGKTADHEKGNGLRDAVVLVIRHAEKPESGEALSPAGEARAKAYVAYFKNFAVDGKATMPTCLFAAADSKASHRPRLTIEPLGKALSLKIDARFSEKQPGELARDLSSKQRGRCVLISYRHGGIPNLLRALGAEPAALLPEGEWPAQVFDWVIQLRFDHEGRLIPAATRRINEQLMPGDSR